MSDQWAAGASVPAHAGPRFSDYHLWHPFTQMESFLKRERITIEGSDGPFLIAANKKRFLNLTSCLWNAPLGLKRVEIIEAIHTQLQTLSYAPLFRASHPGAVRLASVLAGIAPGALNRVFLTSSGSDSVETLIKLIRQYFRLKGSPKYKVLSLKYAYHGVSYAAMAASGFDEDKESFAPLPDGFVQIAPPYCYRCDLGLRYPDCAVACATALERAIESEGAESVAMFLIEPVMGSAGVVVPPPEYLPMVAEICRRHEVVLALDEVATGFGRTGKMFAAEHWDVRPDAMALGKAISGGYYPLGASLVTDEIWNRFLGSDPRQTFQHGSTHSGHPGACAAALATIDLLWADGLMESIRRKGEYLRHRLSELAKLSIVGDIRGLGLMFAIEFVKDKVTRTPLGTEAMQRILRSCFALGLWVDPAGNKLILMPPFDIEEEHLDRACALLMQAVGAVDRRGR